MIYVALLRGINVGGNNKINMKELVDMMKNLGYNTVSTYLNTGNMFFCSDETKPLIAKKIEKSVAERFGLSIRVLIRDFDEIKMIYEVLPHKRTNDAIYKTDILFLQDEITLKQAQKEIQTNPEVDELIFVAGAIIRHISRKNYNKSKMNDFIGTYIYKHMTVRNCNTTRKIYEKMKGLG